ncbi:hypothetical protein C826_00950 [Helicobacter bilis WiWa]|nr:hypothetical protein C826_00950 [Helicobacter bilis WiWa]
MKAKNMRILIILVLLVLVGGVAVYYTNTAGDTQNNRAALETKGQGNKQDFDTNPDKSKDSQTKHEENLESHLDTNESVLPTDTPNERQETQSIKTDTAIPLEDDTLNSNRPQDSKAQNPNTTKVSQDSNQQPKANLNPTANTTESKNNNSKTSPSKTHKDSVTKTATKDNRKSSKDIQNTDTTTSSKKSDKNPTNDNQADSTTLAESNTTQDIPNKDNAPNDETNKDKYEAITTDSNHTNTQDNQESSKNAESKTTNNTENTRQDSNQSNDTLAQNETDSINTQNRSIANTENIDQNSINQDSTNQQSGNKDLTHETSNKETMNNQDDKQNKQEKTTQDNPQDKANQTQPRESTQTGACIAALSCNSSEITRRFAATSLDLHASVRAREEARLKGQSAGDEFMRLWKQTRGAILPKLTSRVSNIYEQDSQVDRETRICVANYYTEVLEDFGNGWKDKKGDKSPMYQVTYQISCKDSNTDKLTILNETQVQGRKQTTTLVRNNEARQKPQGRTPPTCDSDLVYRQFAQAGFYQHAMVRAQEEGRRNGTEAQQKFMQLWDKTKAQITTKLTAHISNIEDKGIQKKTQKRTCVANYYTEVLEDFGNGWKDKKGDKSPYYIVYYAVAYANNEDDSITIDITAQNRIKKPR